MTTSYQFPMYPRLEPRTTWKGGRISEVDVLTLPEAASMASRHAGADVTVADFLRAAGRGEIPLRAVVNRQSTMLPCRDGDGELHVPANSIPTLPIAACQALANVGEASWRHLDGHEASDATDGVPCRFMRWKLPDDEEGIITVPDDCRVTGRDAHALADAFAVSEEGTPPPEHTVSNDEETCAMSEQVLNGQPVDWAYWCARLKLTPHEAAKLTFCIDPMRWTGASHAQGQIDTELQIKISKCAAMLADLDQEWTLQRLVKYLGIDGAPIAMRQAVGVSQSVAAGRVSAYASTKPPPPPVTRLNTSRGPDLSIKYRIEKPNWARWRRLDIVRLWEATCLLVDIEPPVGDGEEIWATYQTAGLPAAYHDAWEVVSADSTLSKLEVLEYSGRMLWKVNLAGFAQWAIDKELQLPAELRLLAERTSTSGQTPIPSAAVAGGLSKREKQIRVIEGAIATLGFAALSIPTGGKKRVEAECKRVAVELFGAGSDPFLDAWKAALKQNRVRTEQHDKYKGG